MAELRVHIHAVLAEGRELDCEVESPAGGGGEAGLG
jgi:hypothetical protein